MIGSLDRLPIATLHRGLLAIEAALVLLLAVSWSAAVLLLPPLWRLMLIVLMVLAARLAGGGTPWRVLGARGLALLVLREWEAFLRNQLRLAFPVTVGEAGRAPPVGRPRDPIVILVHGFACNAGYFGPLPARLAAHGVEARIPTLLPPAAGVAENADHLRAWLDADDALARRPLVLAGISMGGLVVRHAVARHPSRRIGAVITVGTPHGGTLWAWAARGQAGRDMRPNSDLLASLPGATASPPVTVLWSPDDTMIVPAAGARLPGAREIEVPGAGHLTLTFVPETEQAILDAVAEVEAAVSRECRCA